MRELRSTKTGRPGGWLAVGVSEGVDRDAGVLGFSMRRAPSPPACAPGLCAPKETHSGPIHNTAARKLRTLRPIWRYSQWAVACCASACRPVPSAAASASRAPPPDSYSCTLLLPAGRRSRHCRLGASSIGGGASPVTLPLLLPLLPRSAARRAYHRLPAPLQRSSSTSPSPAQRRAEPAGWRQAPRQRGADQRRG